MTDRDYFAAATLIRGMGVLGCEQIAKSCYEMADAMLRERERTNHGAVPEAKADGQGRDNPATPDHVGTGNPQNDASPEAGRPSMGAEDGRVRASALSTGNTQEPVAWAILHSEQQYVSLLREMAEAHNVFAAPIVPLYRSPPLTDAEREAVEAAIHGENDATVIATLRNLLERMK